eukprot:SAG11_NODE_1870_length_4151_cov_2.279368_5_plen_103_part_00
MRTNKARAVEAKARRHRRRAEARAVAEARLEETERAEGAHEEFAVLMGRVSADIAARKMEAMQQLAKDKVVAGRVKRRMDAAPLQRVSESVLNASHESAQKV